MYPYTEQKITTILVHTKRELIEKERTRLKDTSRPDFKKWLDNREYPLPWMKKLFGEKLNKSTEEVHKDTSNRKIECQICGHEFKGLDEKFIYMDFSFCQEYSCGMIICLDCPKLKELKEKGE